MNKRFLYGSMLLWLLMICIDSHAQNTINSLRTWPYYSFENKLREDVRALTWGRICGSSYHSDQNIDHHDDGSVTIGSNQSSIITSIRSLLILVTTQIHPLNKLNAFSLPAECMIAAGIIAVEICGGEQPSRILLKHGRGWI